MKKKKKNLKTTNEGIFKEISFQTLHNFQGHMKQGKPEKLSQIQLF